MLYSKQLSLKSIICNYHTKETIPKYLITRLQTSQSIACLLPGILPATCNTLKVKSRDYCIVILTLWSGIKL